MAQKLIKLFWDQPHIELVQMAFSKMLVMPMISLNGFGTSLELFLRGELIPQMENIQEYRQ